MDRAEQASMLDEGRLFDAFSDLQPEVEETKVIEDKPVEDIPLQKEPEVIPEPEEKELEVPTEPVTDPIPEEGGPETQWGEAAKKFVDSGLLKFNEEGEYEDSEDGLVTLIEENLKNSKVDAISEYKESLSEEGVRLLEHVEQGFSIDDFVKDQQSVIDYDGIDMSEEGNQQMIVEYALEKQGLSNADIAEQVEALKSAGSLDKMANASKASLKTIQENEIAQKETQRLADIEAKTESDRIQKENFEKQVLGLRDIKGIKVDEKESKKLLEYITKPIGKNGETKLQLDDNDESRYLFAYMQMKNFDFKKLEKKAERTNNMVFKKKLEGAKTVGASRSANTTRTMDNNIEEQSAVFDALEHYMQK